MGLKKRWNEKRMASRWLRILTDKYTVATVVFVVVVVFTDANSLLRLLGKKWDLYRQERTIEHYRREISDLDRRLEELTRQRDSIERFAREQYYFQEKDEVVYLVEEE